MVTTQLYFPGEARNQPDAIFDAALLMDLQDSAGGKTGSFSFVSDLP